MFFRIPQEILDSKDKVYVLDIKYADVNGDGMVEALIVTGKKPYGESAFAEDITLIVKNIKTGLNIEVKPGEDAGYEPTLFIGRFEESKVPQVLLSINSGGSGGYYFSYIYSFKNNIADLIFDYNKYNDENVYTAIYEDNYKVSIKSKNEELKGIIDLTAIRDKEYIDNLYDSDGKLKKKVVGTVYGLTGISPLSLFGQPVFKVIAHQRITGLYNADTLGAVETILEYKAESFIAFFTRLVVNM